MKPTLGQIFGVPIPAYFTLLMLGFALAIGWVARWAKREGLRSASIVDAGLAAIVGGVIGGRFLHVLADGYFWDYVHLCTDPSQVGWIVTQGRCAAIEGIWDAAAKLCRPQARDCLAWAKFYQGGLTYYGGLLGGTSAALWILRRDGLPLRKVADTAAPAVALGLVFGRVGCFLGGCCYGSMTQLAVGMRFPPWSPASEGQFRAGLLAHPAMPSLPVHPTQLYEAAGCVVIAVGLGIWARQRGERAIAGQVALLFLALYAVLRFAIEWVRADDRGGFWGLSTSQWIGLAVLVAVAFAWRRLHDGRAGREKS